MKLLLDTQLLLWAAGQPERLPVEARTVIDDGRNQLMFSAASLWEVAIKSGLRRADFRADARAVTSYATSYGVTVTVYLNSHSSRGSRLVSRSTRGFGDRVYQVQGGGRAAARAPRSIPAPQAVAR